MKNMNLKIDKLNIRIKGISPETIRASIDGIDKEILQEFVNQNKGLQEKNIKNIKVNKMELGTIKTTSDVDSSNLRKLIIKSVVQSLPQNNLL